MSEATLAAAPASPLLDLPGAVPAEGLDAGVASHYGDPLREQRTLVAGAGFVDLSHRGVVSVTGEDRLTWLHSLTTQHLSDRKPGDTTEALVLSPHGHVEHAGLFVDDGATAWITVEPGTAPGLVAFLDSMKFLLRVTVADVTAEWAVVWEPSTDTDPGAVTLVDPWRRDEYAGRQRLVARSGLRDYAATAGQPAGVWALEALRIAAHRPRNLLETDHRTLVHEVGWLETAVHLNKGCYRGQETVARVHNLGRPPRRLTFLHLDGSVETLPPHGAPVELDARQVGFVTSSARHYELGPIALAMIKRSTPGDAPLLAGGVAAAQEVVVPA